MNPRKLELCYKGYNMRREEEDRRKWQEWGNYGISALFFAIDHALSGKKARSKYLEKPVSELQKQEYNENELQKKREAFVAGLMAMKANFEISHPKKEVNNEFDRS